MISFGGHRSASIWILFAGCVLLLLGGALYLQKEAWDRDADEAAKKKPPTEAAPNKQSVIINTTNQSGGDNAGIINE